MIHKFIMELTDECKGYEEEVERLERIYGIEPIEEHQIISDVIDYVFSELNRLHISYDSEENSVSTTYYDGTDAETTIDVVKGILKENFVKEVKGAEQ